MDALDHLSTQVYSAGAAGGQTDTFIQKFYEKLSEIFAQWIPLEDVYYRNNEQGEIEFGKVQEIKIWPDLKYFNVAISKNGGPIGKLIISPNTYCSF